MSRFESCDFMCAFKKLPEETELNFIRYLKKQQASPNTVTSCLTSCRLYFSLFDSLDVADLMKFKEHLLKHYKTATVNSRIYGINRFMDSLEPLGGGIPSRKDSGIPPHKGSPSFRLAAVQIQQAPFLNNIISQENYTLLKDSLKSDGNMFWYFVVRFLACTGARVSELVQIKAEHLPIRYMDLYSKGGKVRRIYFPDPLCQEAMEWFHGKGIDSGFIFTGPRGSPITPRGISSQLKVLARRYGIPADTVYPHSFRHRFAKNFLANFNDISLLADLMGHESIETTRIYLNKTTDEQRELIDKIVIW